MVEFWPHFCCTKQLVQLPLANPLYMIMTWKIQRKFLVSGEEKVKITIFKVIGHYLYHVNKPNKQNKYLPQLQRFTFCPNVILCTIILIYGIFCCWQIPPKSVTKPLFSTLYVIITWCSALYAFMPVADECSAPWSSPHLHTPLAYNHFHGKGTIQPSRQWNMKGEL